MLAARSGVRNLKNAEVMHTRLNFRFTHTTNNRVTQSKDFYIDEGKHRRYYYVIDSRGQLFLEDSKFRNYATCLKDKKFLDFFYKQLRPNSSGWSSQIPYISLCGKELNFVTVDDPIAPLVFSDLRVIASSGSSAITSDNNDNMTASLLAVGNSSLRQTFDPEMVSINVDTGRMYHTISNHKYLVNKPALLHPLVAETLSNCMKITPTEHILKWNEQEYLMKQI